MQISIMLSSLGLPFEEALDTVVKLEIPAVQLHITDEDDRASARRKAAAVTERGLKVSAFLADIGDLGEAETAAAKVEKAKPWLDMAAEMANGIWQTHIGVMPYNASGPRWNSFINCAEQLAAYGEKAGACLALETGPEPARVVEKLVRTVDSPGLRVNYDPANFYIWPAVLPNFPDLLEQSGMPLPYDRYEAEREFEPVEGVRRLGPFIAHTHAKDGIGHGGWSDVPLGSGWVDWPRYLTLLQEAGFNGYLAIEREAGDDPIGECAHAANFLREQLKLFKVQN